MCQCFSPILECFLYELSILTVLDMLHTQSNEVLVFFKTKLSENESEDEGVNRAASLLSAFKTIVTTSCWCEPKIICLLFEATKEQKFDQELVAKV